MVHYDDPSPTTNATVDWARQRSRAAVMIIAPSRRGVHGIRPDLRGTRGNSSDQILAMTRVTSGLSIRSYALHARVVHAAHDRSGDHAVDVGEDDVGFFHELDDSA